MNDRSLKSDLLRLGILTGLCLLIGVHLIRGTVLIAVDGVFYIGQAQQVAQDVAGVARRYPAGYPFIVWAAHEAVARLSGHDSTMLWIYSAQGVTLLCRVLALIPLYFLGKLLVGAAKSFWALLVLIVLPYPARYGSDVLREWPYLLFLSLGFWLLYWGLRRRQWWVLGVVGLAAGLGYLIRPECAQLVLYGLLGLSCVSFRGRIRSLAPWGAGLLLVAGFLLPIAPYVGATGEVTPHQLRPSTFNAPPVISAIGAWAASDDPLEFEVREGELLELPIRADDPAGDPLTISLAGVPVGSRPVYEFRLPATEDRVWTTSETEKSMLLATYARQVCEYARIVCYAYVQSDARPGLLLVRRWWSPVQGRHIYLESEAQIKAVLQASPEASWVSDNVAFYVFGPDSHPPDAVPVYRRGSLEKGCSWTVGDRTPRAEDGQQRTAPSPGSQDESRAGAIVWYVDRAGDPPAGAAIEGRVLRWRPRPGQKGDYQLNLIVSDGEVQCCQLVRVRVIAAPEPRTEDSAVPRFPSSVLRSPSGDLRLQHAGLEKLPGAVHQISAGIMEDLMIVFFVPWLLGLYCRLRYQAERTERVLTVGVLIVSSALMLGRHVGLGTGEDRRYSLGLIALTSFYIPVGVEILAQWLNRARAWQRPPWMPSGLAGSPWFYLLMTAGVVVCLPKLLTPLRGDKAGYRAAAEWLGQNTRAEDVLAVPDIRIGFYAQRRGLLYGQQPDSRRADYVVRIAEEEGDPPPESWRREYSVVVDRRSKKILVIYRTAQPKP